MLGGKIAGAGGGGFLMLYCPNDGTRLTEFMERRGFPRLAYNAEFEGSKIIANALSSRALNAHTTSRRVGSVEVAT